MRETAKRPWIAALCTTVVLAAVIFAGTAFTSVSKSEAGNLNRLAAFYGFHDFEIFTNLTAIADDPTGGATVFRRTVFVPSGNNTIFVTLGGAVDAHGGAAVWFTCLMDANFCRPAAGGGTTPSGWVSLDKVPNGGAVGNCNDGFSGGAGDCHDNGVYYTWCRRVRPGRHTIEIRMASGIDLQDVFLEDAFFAIDVARLGRTVRCRKREFTPPIL